jgi:hypothetical protein
VALRPEGNGEAASRVAAVPRVQRGALLPRQRRLRGGRRAWWRTAGTWARWFFPAAADLKVFFERRPPHERAMRRP